MRVICRLHYVFFAGFAAFWWCHFITFPSQQQENGCSCVKYTQHFSTFCEDICDIFAMKMQGIWNCASPSYFVQFVWKSAIFVAKVPRIWKIAVPAYICGLWLIMCWIMRSRFSGGTDQTSASLAWFQLSSEHNSPLQQLPLVGKHDESITECSRVLQSPPNT